MKVGLVMRTGKKTKQNKYLDIFAIVFFAIVFSMVYFILTNENYLYGSTIDWQNQHYVIPEYFRNLFYQTKDIFPSLAMHLGSGQNIFYFAYYGLYSPIILISYLLPNVSMIDYITYSTIILAFSSVVLFYFFLKKHQFNFLTRLVVTTLFMCAGPILYNTHRQIMFINYMPFLILGLYGVDNYFSKKKNLLLVISFFLLIMTSFYFSVSSAFILIIYFTYLYLKNNELFKFKSYMIELLKFSLSFVIAYLLASFLLFPTLNCLLESRGGTNNIHLIKLFIPMIRGKNIIYNFFGMGVTAITLIGLIYTTIKKEKASRFLGITILLLAYLPIGAYLLNGTLYTDPKSLYPLIPLLLLFTAPFINDVIYGKIDFKKLVYIIITICLLSFNLFLVIDSLVLLLIFYLTKKHLYIRTSYIILLSILYLVGVNMSDTLLSRDNFQKENTFVSTHFFDEVDKNNIYRTSNLIHPYNNFNKIYSDKQYLTTMYSSSSNKLYNNFYFDLTANNIPYRTRAMMMASTNPLFQMYMGEKYIISNKESIFHGKLINQEKNIKLYELENTLPIGYATSHLMKNSNYDTLSYPDNILTLLGNVITPDSEQNKVNINYDMPFYTINKTSNVVINNSHRNIDVLANNKGYMNLALDIEPQDKIILVRFTNKRLPENKDEEYSIKVNGIKNRLSAVNWKYFNHNKTFNYVLYNTNNLKFEFTKGSYYLSDLEIIVIDYQEVISKMNDIDPFIFDKERTLGDIYEGDIKVTNEGYFKLSIPYDKGYKIYVNDELTDYEVVDKTFIGFKVSPGNYHIKIVYEAPYLKLGVITSLVSLTLYIITIIITRKKPH